jgi:hypothetical protein
MGCDIHIYVEKKNNTNRPNISGGLLHAPVCVFEPWVAVKGVNDNTVRQYEKWATEDGKDSYWGRSLEEAKKGSYSDWVYDGRNYDLFAILADVRNGRGFAGVKTGEGFNVIAEPKGIPSDMSKIVAADYEEWMGDAHSTSWLTLRELKDFNWNQETHHTGVINIGQYAEYVKLGHPNSWSSGASGSMVRYLSLDQANYYLKGKLELDEELSYYVRVSWTEKYSESAGNFLEYSMPELEKLSVSDDQDDVRIVFWFDN